LGMLAGRPRWWHRDRTNRLTGICRIRTLARQNQTPFAGGRIAAGRTGWPRHAHLGNSSPSPSRWIVRPGAAQSGKEGRGRKQTPGEQPGHRQQRRTPLSDDEVDKSWKLAGSCLPRLPRPAARRFRVTDHAASQVDACLPPPSVAAGSGCAWSVGEGNPPGKTVPEPACKDCDVRHGCSALREVLADACRGSGSCRSVRQGTNHSQTVLAANRPPPTRGIREGGQAAPRARCDRSRRSTPHGSDLCRSFPGLPSC
jgi:hypothetical protein